MKGGITSGVIYPRLVAKLSEVYRFRSIGGTSAGAIAAGAAAAAQLGVTTGGNPKAFAELDKLPELLGGPAKNADGSMLLNLFQPQPPFRRHFALLTSALNARSRTLTGLAVAWAAVWRFPMGALLGALPGALVAWYSAGLARGLGIAFAVIGLLGAASLRLCARFHDTSAGQQLWHVQRHGQRLDPGGRLCPSGCMATSIGWRVSLVMSR